MQGIIYMSETGFIIIYSWMVKELNLKGNELILYALIHGFTENGVWFRGSLSYLSESTNLSRQCVIDTLAALQKRGYIERNEVPHKGIKYIDYRVVKRWSKKLTSQENGLVKNIDKGSQKSVPHVVKNLYPKIIIQNNNKINNARAKKNKFHNYPQRTDTDYDMIEDILTGKMSTPNDKGSEDDIKSN